MEDNIIHIELDDEFIEENEVIEVPKEKTIEEVIEEKIIDKLEEKVAEIPIPKDGKDGPKGKDGKTPTKTELKAIVKPLVPTAKEIAEIVLPKIPKPKDGEKGEDGKSFRFADLTAYEKQILTGPPGSTGVGVPRGGTVNQKLAKRTSKDFDTEWVDDSAGGTWGSITGTLSDQTDLQNALNAKFTLPSLTNGSVLFSNGTTIAQDNTGFYYDDTLNRLSLFSTVGSELVTNGNFTGSATGWTVGSGYAYSSNSVSKTTNGTSALSQTISANKGREHLCTFTISNWTVGTVTVSCGGITGTAVGANGTYTFRFVPTNSNALAFTPTNTARFTIDTVSVKVLTGGEIRTGYMNIDGSWSNGTPGTTRAQSFNNAGSYTWTDYNFSGVLRASMGANSSGGYDMYTSGGNGVAFFNGNSGLTSNSMYSYNYVNYFYHSGNIQAGGYGMFGSSVGAGTGAGTTPTSTLQSGGSTALKVKRLTASGNLDSTASHWLLDGTSASACTGTPSTSTCSTYTGSGQATCEAHLPCAWYPGDACSAFNYEGGMGTCSGTSGCSVDTASCGGAGDQSSCESQDDSYGGSCAWTEGFADCSGIGDEGTCTGTSGCTSNFGDCSPYSDGGGDGSACSGYNAACSYDSGSGTCSGTPFLSCSGTYSTGFSCTGNYNTGTCSGMYGTACTGTVTCSSYGTQTPCEAETGCAWSAVLNAQLPDGETCPDRTYWLKNDASGGADAIILPYSGQTIEKTTSLTLASYQDGVHIAYFKKTYDCSNYVSAGTCTPTGCTANYSNCSWSSDCAVWNNEGDCTGNGCSWDGMSCYGGSTCSGNAVCTGIGDQGTCEATTYFSSCSGTETISKNWYIYSRT